MTSTVLVSLLVKEIEARLSVAIAARDAAKNLRNKLAINLEKLELARMDVDAEDSAVTGAVNRALAGKKGITLDLDPLADAAIARRGANRTYEATNRSLQDANRDLEEKEAAVKEIENELYALLNPITVVTPALTAVPTAAPTVAPTVAPRKWYHKVGSALKAFADA